MVRDTLLGFPSHSLPYRYRKSCHFIDSLRLSHKRWLSPIINHVIARPVRKLVVAIRIPVPSAPLPKAGWHGEAVTGGFFPRTPCKNLSLRGQFANWLWQSASPVPSAPLPKGGWHGEAVTGGFRSPLHPLQRPRRGDPCGRPREGQSPSPTHRKIRFRRAGCPQPAARQPPHQHGGVRARRPTQVFRHFRSGGRLCPPPTPYRTIL